MLIITKYYGDFSFNWSREWIWHTRVYDDGTIDCGTLPCYMSMPPKGAPLARNRELVSIILAWSYGTLCNVCWTVCPSGSQLLDSVPAPITFIYFGIESQSIALVTMDYIWYTPYNLYKLPMDSGVYRNAVGNLDLHILSFIYRNCWSWKLPIYCQYGFSTA